MDDNKLARTAAAVERYIEQRLFDPQGIMYSYIDARTDRPFERGAVTTGHVPVRAHFDPWAYWSYEDSIMAMGLYLDALVRKFEITGERACLDRAHQLWLVVQKIFSCSQVYGIGGFLRPYGGFVTMGAFAEPLGTDQASPLFSGLYLYSRHANTDTRDQIADMMLKTLTWYERQGFGYFYYKLFIHAWTADYQHAASYYLPAIAWAAKLTGEKKWSDLLRAKLALFQDPRYQIYRWGQGSFCWGSDLLILRELLGPQFEETFSPAMLDDALRHCLTDLKRFCEPGATYYQHAEAKQPGFKPYMHPMEPPYARDGGMGFPELYTVHAGRPRAIHEIHCLCALAALGYPEAIEQAGRLVAIPERVPRDFVYLVTEETDEIPDSLISARSVGVYLVDWLRNYWLLRQSLHKAGTAGPDPAPTPTL